ncbi:unnamed protein product, partial [Ectocarpus sp. 8 AP-2014]
QQKFSPTRFLVPFAEHTGGVSSNRRQVQNAATDSIKAPNTSSAKRKLKSLATDIPEASKKQDTSTGRRPNTRDMGMHCLPDQSICQSSRFVEGIMFLSFGRHDGWCIGGLHIWSGVDSCTEGIGITSRLLRTHNFPPFGLDAGYRGVFAIETRLGVFADMSADRLLHSRVPTLYDLISASESL